MPINHAQIRQFIMETFSDSELETLCFDYFPKVAEEFARGMTKGEKVKLLIGYCQRRGMADKLEEALATARPIPYQNQFGRRRVAATATAVTVPTRNSRQVFISYAQKDSATAQRLAGDLEAEGWAVWMAPDSIRAGEKWVAAIERGLEESGVFVLLLSPAALKSRWVTTETEIAIEMEHDGEMRLFPLLLEPCRIRPTLRRYQRISLRGGYEVGWQKLLQRLEGEMPRRRQVEQMQPRPQAAEMRLLAQLQDGQATVRQEAALALGRLEQIEDETANALRQLYDNDQTDAPRHAALRALLAVGRAADVGMVHIPAGKFLMGSSDDDPDAQDNEKPQHWLHLPDYFIDRAPVTNAQFAQFMAAGGYANRDYWAEAIAVGRWENGRFHDWYDEWHNQPRYWHNKKWNGEQQPVVGVSWYEAVAYTRWAGKRLPTEAEWEKAASWEAGRSVKRRYPWGNNWQAERANTEEAWILATTEIGRFSPAGDSPCGLVDMAGNVWEWCSTGWENYPYDDRREALDGGVDIIRVLRGGSWQRTKEWARCAIRYDDLPWDRDDDIGFRCCATSSLSPSSSEF